ncbi:hypothetical protein [Deinococcus sp.]|uniref:hypothetical protein n=1 Tax=Deinococcus sp. TaxID=47478 RepID=UPI0025C1F9BE|nr:hypothetical protein [Deinococcus sp.]
MTGRKSDSAFLPILIPGQTTTLWLAPHATAQIRRRTEGRGDPNSTLVWSGHTSGQGQVEVTLPPGAPQTYDGLLFRVLWEVECAGEVQRLVVGSGAWHPDPYAALGLPGNPFCAEEIPARQMDWEGVTPQHWLERGYSVAPSPGTQPGVGQLVQLLGVKGAGKSSHLAHWRRQNPGPGHYYPPRGHERWRPPPLAPICYWDEACRIPTPLLHWGLSRAARAGYTVCVGTHRDLAAEARRYGLTVQSIELRGISAGDILAWAARRIESARLAAGFEIPSTLAEQLACECGGSWREIATRLHIFTAQQAQEKQR